MTVDFEEGSFDLVVAFYSITNMPLDDHEPLLSRTGRRTRPNGQLLWSTI
jgi:hypothetical protein